MRCWTPNWLIAAACLGGVTLTTPATGQSSAPIQLAEIVSANDGAYRDEDGDASDWIELHNASAEAVALEGWGLSDRAAQPFKWVFPAQSLAPGARLVVFASGKDRAPADGPVHTNFSLAAEGEALFLTSPDGAVVVAAPPADIPEGLSYGWAVTPGTWRYFANPTPNLPNTGLSFAELLRTPPTPSTPGGFHDNPLDLRFDNEDGTELRVTLDGSEPDESSPVFPEFLTVRSRVGEPNGISMIQGTSTANQHTDGWKPPLGEVRKATVVRARRFKPDARPSPVATHTFFVGTEARHTDGLPVVSLATEPAGLFDYDHGIYMLGRVFDAYVAAHPGEPLTGHTPANYTQRGANWNRAASIEFFEPSGVRAFAQPVRIDIKGQSTRSFRQKSFGLDVRDDEGGRGRIVHPLFPGLRRRGDGGPLDSFRTLRLRNMGNDWAYAAMRDAFCHGMADGLDLEHMAWRPISVYLDGEYWGVLEMREELDSDSLEAHFGVPREEVVIVNASGGVVEGVAGDEAPFIALRTYAESHDLSVPEHFNHVAARMDVDNFLLYQWVEIWCGNADWPHNNTRVWRRRIETPTTDPGSAGVPGRDGRWRWMLFDLDLAAAHPWAGGASENTLSYALSPTGRPPTNAPWATALLRALLKNPDVKRRFATLAADLLNAHFSASRATRLVDTLRSTMQPAMPEHIRRWQSNGNNAATWSSSLVGSVRSFASQRPVNVRQHFTTQLALGGYATLTADVSPAGAGTVVINRRLRLDAALPGVADPVYPWRGTYFRAVPVVLEAEPAAGFLFAGWFIPTGLDPRRSVELSLAAATTVTASFVPAPSAPPLDLHLANEPASGLPRLVFQGVAGAAYALEESTDMVSWVRNQAFLADEAGRWEFTMPIPSPSASSLPAHYFRVVIP
jgi:hypothetical protein